MQSLLTPAKQKNIILIIYIKYKSFTAQQKAGTSLPLLSDAASDLPVNHLLFLRIDKFGYNTDDVIRKAHAVRPDLGKIDIGADEVEEPLCLLVIDPACTAGATVSRRHHDCKHHRSSLGVNDSRAASAAK